MPLTLIATEVQRYIVPEVQATPKHAHLFNAFFHIPKDTALRETHARNHRWNGYRIRARIKHDTLFLATTKPRSRNQNDSKPHTRTHSHTLLRASRRAPHTGQHWKNVLRLRPIAARPPSTGSLLDTTNLLLVVVMLHFTRKLSSLCCCCYCCYWKEMARNRIKNGPPSATLGTSF